MKADCISCGFPAAEVEKHGVDIGKEYCGYCANEDGTLKSYGQVLAGFAGFLMSQNVPEKAAYKQAMTAMEDLPAWH